MGPISSTGVRANFWSDTWCASRRQQMGHTRDREDFTIPRLETKLYPKQLRRAVKPLSSVVVSMPTAIRSKFICA